MSPEFEFFCAIFLGVALFTNSNVINKHEKSY